MIRFLMNRVHSVMHYLRMDTFILCEQFESPGGRIARLIVWP